MSRVIIIECIPKKEGKNESVILKEFLGMTMPDDIRIPTRRRSRSEVVDYLRTKRDLDDCDYVHLSGHGKSNLHSCTGQISELCKDCEPKFDTPKGSLKPDEFPNGCFSEKTVTISSCCLGRRSFVDRFIDHTQAKNVIAPLHPVEFIDSTLWFSYFYYQALHLGYSPAVSYNRTENALGNLKGGFKRWT